MQIVFFRCQAITGSWQLCTVSRFSAQTLKKTSPGFFYRELRKPRPLTCQRQSIKSYDVETEVHVGSTRHRDRKMWQTHTNSRGVNHLVARYTPHSDRSRKGKRRCHVYRTVRTNTTSTSNNSINNKLSFLFGVELFQSKSSARDPHLMIATYFSECTCKVVKPTSRFLFINGVTR